MAHWNERWLSDWEENIAMGREKFRAPGDPRWRKPDHEKRSRGSWETYGWKHIDGADDPDPWVIEVLFYPGLPEAVHVHDYTANYNYEECLEDNEDDPRRHEWCLPYDMRGYDFEIRYIQKIIQAYLAQTPIRVADKRRMVPRSKRDLALWLPELMLANEDEDFMEGAKNLPSWVHR
jgi:hypothetical protein